MGDYLILDTGVLVAMERKRFPVEKAITPHDDVVVPAIAIAEYLTGVHRAQTQRQREARQAFLDHFLADIPVVGYTRDTALHHARLLAYTASAGRTRGAHDLIIAATAAATARTLVTTDKAAEFDTLPGVTARVVEPLPR